MDEIDETDDSRELEISKQIEEEYEQWSQNAQSMYDLIWECEVDGSSLTFQWLPNADKTVDEFDVVTERFLLGTAPGTKTQLVRLGELRWKPKDPRVRATFQSGDRAAHPGEVNKARYMPQHATVVATASNNGGYYIFDTTKFTDDIAGVEPSYTRLVHHHETSDGFGLSWNALEAGKLVTGTQDQTCAVWDISVSGMSQTLSPVRAYGDPRDADEGPADGSAAAWINDVKWNPTSASVFGAVTENRLLRLYDVRAERNAPVTELVAHDREINTLAFSRHNPYLVVTGAGDSQAGLWDTRNLSRRLHTLVGHGDSIIAAEWSPHFDGVLATSSEDRRVIMWDISRIGEEQSPEDAEDGAPELLFMHGGHRSKVEDFDWHPEMEWTVGSVDTFGHANIWRPSRAIVGGEGQVVKDGELE